MKAIIPEVQASTLPELMTSVNTSLTAFTYKDAKNLKTEVEWRNLAQRPVREGIELWLAQQTPLTQRNYASGMRQLARFGYIDLDMSLQAFALVNFENVLAHLKTDNITTWSQCTRQARCACYISFTGFLNGKYPHIFRKAVPCKSGGENSKIFYKVHKQVASNAMTKQQWTIFLQELDKISLRDGLIARLCLQGAKRISETLSLTTNQINWSKSEITFKQLKTRGGNDTTTITFAPGVMLMLKGYINGREGLVFISKSGKRVYTQYLAKSFALAGERAGICLGNEREGKTFRVHPHNLRTSSITQLKTLGFSDSDIMKMSGHASSAMVNAYDKSDKANNASKKVNLVD